MVCSNVSVMSTIGPCDVLLGRSRKAYMHAGNKAYRTLIKKKSFKYKRDASRAAKTTIVVETFETIKAKGGRFLRFSQGNWSQISDSTAKQKVSHSLRDARRDFPCELDDRLRTSTTTPRVFGSATTMRSLPPCHNDERQYIASQLPFQPAVSVANHTHQYCSREEVTDFKPRTNGISLPLVDRLSTTEHCRPTFPGGRGGLSSYSHFFQIKDAAPIVEDPILVSAPNDIQLKSQKEALWFSCCEHENFDIFAGCERDQEDFLELFCNHEDEQINESDDDSTTVLLRQLQDALELCDDLDDDLDDDDEEHNATPWIFWSDKMW